jgi:hypothetical protein
MTNHTIAEHALIIEFEGDVWHAGADDDITFGRDADIVVDAGNPSLHRVLGRLRRLDDHWYLANLGRSVSLVASDNDGASFARVAPGAQVPLPFARTTVTFSAGRANYRLSIEVARPHGLDEPAGIGRRGIVEPGHGIGLEQTLTSATLVFNEDQYDLLVALAAPRLLGPITIADLPSNRQLARQLGWSPSKLTRKLDHLCAKFERVGVAGLVGSTAGTATERRLLLADLAVEHRLVPRTTVDG